MLPYVKRGESRLRVASGLWNPDAPEPMPDAMEQEPVIQEILG